MTILKCLSVNNTRLKFYTLICLIIFSCSKSYAFDARVLDINGAESKLEFGSHHQIRNSIRFSFGGGVLSIPFEKIKKIEVLDNKTKNKDFNLKVRIDLWSGFSLNAQTIDFNFQGILSSGINYSIPFYKISTIAYFRPKKTEMKIKRSVFKNNPRKMKIKAKNSEQTVEVKDSRSIWKENSCFISNSFETHRELDFFTMRSGLAELKIPLNKVKLIKSINSDKANHLLVILNDASKLKGKSISYWALGGDSQYGCFQVSMDNLEQVEFIEN